MQGVSLCPSVDALTNVGDQAALEDVYSEYHEALIREAEASDASAQKLNAGAREFLTCPLEHRRDPQRALEFANRAAISSNREIAPVLGTLAHALAENGQFDDAVATQREAIAALPAAASDAMRAEVEAVLQRYLERRRTSE